MESIKDNNHDDDENNVNFLRLRTGAMPCLSNNLVGTHWHICKYNQTCI